MADGGIVELIASTGGTLGLAIFAIWMLNRVWELRLEEKDRHAQEAQRHAEELKEMDGDIKINIYQPGMIKTNLSTNAKVVPGWGEQENVTEYSNLALDYLGTDINESCPKVLPYVLPSCRENGKTFRGFKITSMIRGGIKLRKFMKNSNKH